MARKAAKPIEPLRTLRERLEEIANAPGVLNANGINIWYNSPTVKADKIQIKGEKINYRAVQTSYASDIYLDTRSKTTDGIAYMRSAATRRIKAMIAKGEKQLQARGKTGIGYQVFTHRIAVQGPIKLT